MHTHVCTYANACVYTYVYRCISVCVHLYTCVCVDVYVCGVCIYRCIYVHIYTHTHVHTRTETHIRVCVCVCLSVCLSVGLMRAHAHICGESTSILQKGLFCPTPIKASDTSTSKRETTPDERSGQEAGTDFFLPKKGGTDRHSEAQGRTHIHGRAGLGWAGAAGGGGGLTEAPHPVAFPWTMILLIRRGKAQEPGIAITTASSNHQRTVAPDGLNAPFLQLRKLWADSERPHLIPWCLTDRETISLGKRVLRCTLPQRLPH